MYREALRLRPGYTRAVYNVGVACLNLGAYQEAAEHFLGGLAMQGDPSGSDATKRSEQLWSTLRRTLVSMVSVSCQVQPTRLALIYYTSRIVQTSLTRLRTETWTSLGLKGSISNSSLQYIRLAPNIHDICPS